MISVHPLHTVELRPTVRVSVDAYGGRLRGRYVSADGPDCIGGGRMALVKLERSPDVVTMVAAGQVAAGCDWHGCTAPATVTVRADNPRPGVPNASLMWLRCDTHTGPVDLDAR